MTPTHVFKNNRKFWATNSPSCPTTELAPLKLQCDIQPLSPSSPTSSTIPLMGDQPRPRCHPPPAVLEPRPQLEVSPTLLPPHFLHSYPLTPAYEKSSTNGEVPGGGVFPFQIPHSESLPSIESLVTKSELHPSFALDLPPLPVSPTITAAATGSVSTPTITPVRRISLPETHPPSSHEPIFYDHHEASTRSSALYSDSTTDHAKDSSFHDRTAVTFHASQKAPFSLDQRMFLTKNAHIKRPRNAWIHFRCHYGQALKAQDPTLRAEEISRYASRRWANLTEAEKRPWHALAEQEKQAHKEAFPEYRYCPKRNSTSTPGTPSTPTGHYSRLPDFNHEHQRPEKRLKRSKTA